MATQPERLATLETKVDLHAKVGGWVAAIIVGALAAGIGLIIDLSTKVGLVQGEVSKLAKARVVDQVEDRILAGDADGVTKELNDARLAGVTLDPEVVSDLVSNAINAGSAGWQAALSLVNYRSAIAPPLTEELTPLGSGTRYRLVPPIGREDKRPQVYAKWGAPTSETSPILEPIGQNLNKGVVVSPLYLVVRGGLVQLDGLHVRNVVFEKTEIAYNGGITRLEGVKFLNCTFLIERSPAGELLLASVAGPSETTSFRMPMAALAR